MALQETYKKWKHLREFVKDFGKIYKKGDDFDIRLAMLSDCWTAIEESLRNYMSIDNSRYREFNSQFSEIKIKTSGNRGYGKSYALIKKFLDYSDFEIIEPSTELKKTFANKKKDKLLIQGGNDVE